MGLKELIQTHWAASWRNSRMLASWPHSRVPWSFPLSQGSYIILRGMLYSPRRHSHTYRQLGVFWDSWERKESQNFYLFIYLFLVLGESQETLGREDLFLRNWAKLVFEYLKWQDSFDSSAEGLPLELFFVALLSCTGAIRIGWSLCYWPELF